MAKMGHRGAPDATEEIFDELRTIMAVRAILL